MLKRSFFFDFAVLSSLLLVGSLPLAWGDPNPTDVRPLVKPLGPGLFLEMDPRIELLAGVQSWTSWTTDPQSDGFLGSPPTTYAQQLREALAAFHSHQAMTIAQNLHRGHGFSYDAPPAFVLSGDHGLVFDRPVGGYSRYLTGRAGGEAILNLWAEALRDLANKASFAVFFEAHRPYYEGLLDQASRGLDAEPLAQWLKDYYGSTGEFVFHFVLAPALMPGGGYGTTVVRTEGGRQVTHVYQVIRDAQNVSGERLAGLTLHEFGHSFVNPAIGERVPLLARFGLERLWAPVKERMRELAYGSMETFLNELVLRATTIRGQRMEGLVSDEGVKDLLATEAQKGFYPIGAVYRELADYEAHRDRWPRFHDFGPELLNRLAAQAGTLANTATAQSPLIGSFRADFEGQGSAPGAPFALSEGASTSGDGRASEVLWDTRDAAGGKTCLTLRGQAETSTWHFVGTDLALQKGTVVARFDVRGKNLKREAEQFNNAYAGFIVEEKSGKKAFEVRPYQGTFGWLHQEIRLVVDPATTRSVRFGFFLSISGELSFDEVSVDWE